MTNESLELQLEKLIEGELTEMVIAKENFMQFREIWMNHIQKDHIIGEAKHNGEVVYRFRTNS